MYIVVIIFNSHPEPQLFEYSDLQVAINMANSYHGSSITIFKTLGNFKMLELVKVVK